MRREASGGFRFSASMAAVSWSNQRLAVVASKVEVAVEPPPLELSWQAAARRAAARNKEGRRQEWWVVILFRVMRSRILVRRLPTVPERKPAHRLPEKSGSSIRPSGRSGRATAGLALGLVLLAAVVFSLWRSAGERGPERPDAAPAPTPLPGSLPRPTTPLETATTPRVAPEPARTAPVEQASARLVVAVLGPEGAVL